MNQSHSWSEPSPNDRRRPIETVRINPDRARATQAEGQPGRVPAWAKWRIAIGGHFNDQLEFLANIRHS